VALPRLPVFAWRCSAMPPFAIMPRLAPLADENATTCMSISCMQTRILPAVNESQLRRRFGEEVRRLRKAAGLSQEGLAEACDIHRTFVGFIERGERTVTLMTAYKLAQGLGLRLCELLKRVDE
jgi:ribosome-binding protein aMBF1 (putative translation factor)